VTTDLSRHDPSPVDTTPVWRSMLFIPAHIEKFVAKAHARGADACILDLEDSVPLASKAVARAAIAPAATAIAAQGVDVLVRINAVDDGIETLVADLDAVVDSNVAALVLPKVERAAAVQAVAGRLDALETARGLASGHVRLIAQIEHVRALPNLDEIATASPRLLGMSLGSEDFSVSAGMEPVTEALLWPNQQVAFACRRAGLLPLGFPGSIADYSDAARFERVLVLARQLGFVGAFCIHPDQVVPLNAAFTPPAGEVEAAQELLAAYEIAQREGRGAFSFQGRMVDAPVVARAQELMRRHFAIARTHRGTMNHRGPAPAS
jgi:citrate lyase subunit beta/citryl-CoA lyase